MSTRLLLNPCQARLKLLIFAKLLCTHDGLMGVFEYTPPGLMVAFKELPWHLPFTADGLMEA
jgi:hypothetical protein